MEGSRTKGMLNDIHFKGAKSASPITYLQGLFKVGLLAVRPQNITFFFFFPIFLLMSYSFIFWISNPKKKKKEENLVSLSTYMDLDTIKYLLEQGSNHAYFQLSLFTLNSSFLWSHQDLACQLHIDRVNYMKIGRNIQVDKFGTDNF